jgi:hypothetical protein
MKLYSYPSMRVIPGKGPGLYFGREPQVYRLLEHGHVKREQIQVSELSPQKVCQRRCDQQNSDTPHTMDFKLVGRNTESFDPLMQGAHLAPEDPYEEVEAAEVSASRGSDSVLAAGLQGALGALTPEVSPSGKIMMQGAPLARDDPYKEVEAAGVSESRVSDSALTAGLQGALGALTPEVSALVALMIDRTDDEILQALSSILPQREGLETCLGAVINEKLQKRAPCTPDRKRNAPCALEASPLKAKKGNSPIRSHPMSDPANEELCVESWLKARSINTLCPGQSDDSLLFLARYVQEVASRAQDIWIMTPFIDAVGATTVLHAFKHGGAICNTVHICVRQNQLNEAIASCKVILRTASDGLSVKLYTSERFHWKMIATMDRILLMTANLTQNHLQISQGMPYNWDAYAEFATVCFKEQFWMPTSPICQGCLHAPAK